MRELAARAMGSVWDVELCPQSTEQDAQLFAFAIWLYILVDSDWRRQ
jgi:hypothetical protein